MPRWRRWPRPFDGAVGAVHLVGDLHFGSAAMTPTRVGIITEDLARLPGSQLSIACGDVIDGEGVMTEETDALAFLTSAFGAPLADWVACVGNHDALRSGVAARTMDQAAQAWGQPSSNFVVQLDTFNLIIIAPDSHDGSGMQPLTPTRINWINTQMQAASGKPCLICCHWPMKDTVGIGPRIEPQYVSSDPFFHAHAAADIITMLADNPNAAGWLSGHTHTPITGPQLVCSVDVGPRHVAAINASAVAYTGTDKTKQTHLHTMYAVIGETGGVEVRFRDHGAGTWCGAGPDRLWRWSA